MSEDNNLWGDLSTLKMIRTPKTILAEQADFLNQATGGVIRAQVSSTQSGANLSYNLVIVAPVLSNYSYSVCAVSHDINVYPCKLYSYATNSWQDCEHEQDLKEKLAVILRGDKTRRVIESLLSQSQA